MSHAGGDGRLLSNRILSLLPLEEYGRLAPHFRYVELRPGDVLCRPEGPVPYVYFPLSRTVSVTARMRDGREVEVGSRRARGDGRDARLPRYGVGALQGGGAGFGQRRERRSRGLPRRVVAGRRAAPAALEVRAGVLRAGGADGRLQPPPPVAGRPARWLLTARGRTQSDEFGLTQEFVALMLGVRRAGVSEAISALERSGLVGHARGRIRILDVPGLGALSCECCGVVRREFDRLVAYRRGLVPGSARGADIARAVKTARRASYSALTWSRGEARHIRAE